MRRLSYHTPSPPVSPRLPPVTDAGMEDNTGEEGAGLEPEVSEHQQAVMQHEERVLTEQIERLEKEKYVLLFHVFSQCHDREYY